MAWKPDEYMFGMTIDDKGGIETFSFAPAEDPQSAQALPTLLRNDERPGEYAA